MHSRPRPHSPGGPMRSCMLLAAPSPFGAVGWCGPPDSAVVESWPVAQGPTAVRRLVVAGARGWTEIGGRVAPMDSATLAHERGQFYLDSVLRLVPLRHPAVRLSALAADSAGRPGFRAARAGWPTVEVYLGPDGRPARLRNRVQEPGSGREVVQDAWAEGTIESGGVRWPRRLRLTWDEGPYFDLSLTEFEVRRGLDMPLTGARP